MEKGLEKTLICESPPLTLPIQDKNIEFCYIIPKTWWLSWCSYVGYGSQQTSGRPEPLDNSSVVLSKSFQDSFVFLSKSSWRKLKSWYSAGPAKKVFIHKGYPKYKTSTVQLSLPDSFETSIKVSLKMTLSQFKELIIKKFSLSGEFSVLTLNALNNWVKLEFLYVPLKQLNFFDGIKVKFQALSLSENPNIIISDFETISLTDDEEKELQSVLKESLKESSRKEVEIEIEMEDIRPLQKNNIKKEHFSCDSGQKKHLKINSVKKIKKNINRILLNFNNI